ncbi:MAG: DUF89 family protein [Deltaproteobacteria bacterium]|nr:DUF89 family protein [Deltaproteobacteria bacterium]
MNTYLECIPCFFRQALFAARAATNDERKAKQVLDKVAALIPDLPLDSPPTETARLIYSAIREVTGVFDPFKVHKEESIKNALSLYPRLKSAVECSEDPLRTAVRIAIAGNVIDLGANTDFDLDDAMEEILRKELWIDHYESFKRSVAEARTILYLGDNAGETVFDRILIETLEKDTVYAVRDVPVINDATIEDAQKSGIGKLARIVSSGCDAPGTILKRCSQEFLDIFEMADVILSKGQGNLESLSGEEGPIFFLLKVKCPVIAQHLGAKAGEMILKDGRLKKISAFEYHGRRES